MTRPLKILLISAEFPTDRASGGIGTYVATVAPALAELGHSVVVLARSPDERDSYQHLDQVALLSVADRKAPPSFWQAPFDPVAAGVASSHYDRAFTVAASILDQPELQGVDVIEAPDWAGEAALVRAAVPQVPYVVRFHTPARLVFRWNDASVGDNFIVALHALETIAVHGASAFTSPSRWIARPCEELFHLPAGSVLPIANPFDARPFLAAASCAPELRADEVVYLGRLESRKGVLDVIEPMLRVLEAIPTAHWTLLGSDTSSAPGGGSVQATLLQALPDRLRHRVTFRGRVAAAELPEILARARAVVLPSRFENFPYACLEAMAAGCAVIASKNGGMAEMIAHGRDGLLVDPADPHAVMEALLRVLCYPRLACALGRAARVNVQERYQPRAIAARLAEHYQSVVPASRHSGQRPLAATS